MGNHQGKNAVEIPNMTKEQHFQNVIIKYKCMNQDPVASSDRTYYYNYDFGTPRSKLMVLNEGFAVVGGVDSVYTSFPPCSNCKGKCPYYWSVVPKRNVPAGTRIGFYTSNGEYKTYNV